MSIDYVDIGKRIRSQREKQKLSQEKLAEWAGVSIQHISNIEKANTKLSLPVLIDIANALQCNVETLLLSSLQNNSVAAEYIITELLEDTTREERIIIIDTIQAMKKSLKENRKEV